MKVMISSNYLNGRRNSIVSVFEVILSTLIIGISYKFIISHHGIAVLGVWSVLNSWLFFVRSADPGLGQSVSRYVSTLDGNTEFPQVRLYVDTALVFNCAVFLMLGFITFYLLSNNITSILPGQESISAKSDILKMLCITVFFQGFSGVYLGALIGVHLGYVSSIIRISAAVIQLFLVIILVPSNGLVGLAVAEMFRAMFISLVGWVTFSLITRKLAILSGLSLWIPLLFRRQTLLDMMQFSISSQVVKLGDGAFLPLTKILISRSFGLEVLGIFEIASKVVEKTKTTLTTPINALNPVLTRLIIEKDKSVFTFYQSLLKLACFKSLYIFMLLLAASPIISKVIFDELNWFFCQIVAVLIVGYYFVVASSPANIIGRSVGILRYNMQSALFSILSVGIAGFMSEIFQSITVFLLLISLVLILKSLYLRAKNEKLLFT
jgi:O-antigen/teichoic acid export membrane protein